jgi:pyruvate formate lyase activating enzyme
MGIKLDTNGTNPTLLKDLLDNHLLDYVAMDIKAPLDKEKYCQVAGVEVNLDLIRKSISLLQESTISYEFRTTLLPLFFDPQDIIDIAREIRGAKQYVLQNFNPQNPLDPRLKEVAPFSPSELETLAQKVRGYLEEIRVIY